MDHSSLLRRAKHDQRGSIGVVMALFMMVAIGACALAIDMGSLYLERRTAQGAADLAALAAASDLDRAQAAAAATLAANDLGTLRSLTVVKGRYDLDPSLLAAKRFEAGKQPYNAARVDVALAGHLYFAKSLMPSPEITVSAIGTAPAEAVFSIGSRLAAVRGGLSNAILGALLGGSVNLSVMDYQALLNGNVKLFDFFSALATEVGVQAGTYSDVLNANASVGDVLSAAAQAATAGGDAQGAAVISALLGQAHSTAIVPLNSLVDLGSIANLQVGQSHPGLGADVNLMSLVSAVAQLSNGQNQVAINLAGSVPGLLSLTLDLAIGEPQQSSGVIAAGQPGTIVRTAQTRLRLIAEVGGSGLLSGVRIRLPIYIELASAEALLKSVTCPGGDPAHSAAVVQARPAVVRAWIGDVSSAGLSTFTTSPVVSQALVVQAPLIRVTGGAYAEMSNTAASDLNFSQSEVDSHIVKTAQTHDFLSSVTSSLLQSLNLNVTILGFGIGLEPIVKGLVLTALTPVTAALDSLLAPLLDTIGVHLGEVDVEVNGLRCGSGVLAG